MFWSMTSKAEFSRVRAFFIYICSIYVATTYLATIFYKKMEQIYKKGTGLSLPNSAFDVTDQKIILYLPASHCSIKVNPEVIFQNFKCNLHHDKTLELNWLFCHYHFKHPKPLQLMYTFKFFKLSTLTLKTLGIWGTS